MKGNMAMADRFVRPGLVVLVATLVISTRRRPAA
jgi:hypothetical protein